LEAGTEATGHSKNGQGGTGPLHTRWHGVSQSAVSYYIVRIAG